METKIEKITLTFVGLWGEMASNWGISKSMAQVFALLFISTEPLDTETIMERLNISRGNANINIRKLLEWGIIQKADRKEARREYFVAEKDVWHLTHQIIDERQKLEINPVSESIRTLGEQLNDEDLTPEMKQFKDNILQMAQFMALFNEVVSVLKPMLRDKNIDQIQQLMLLLKPINDNDDPAKHL